MQSHVATVSLLTQMHGKHVGYNWPVVILGAGPIGQHENVIEASVRSMAACMMHVSHQELTSRRMSQTNTFREPRGWGLLECLFLTHPFIVIESGCASRVVVQHYF